MSALVHSESLGSTSQCSVQVRTLTLPAYSEVTIDFPRSFRELRPRNHRHTPRVTEKQQTEVAGGEDRNRPWHHHYIDRPCRSFGSYSAWPFPIARSIQQREMDVWP